MLIFRNNILGIVRFNYDQIKTKLYRFMSKKNDNFVRVLPCESDITLDQKDHYTITFSNGIKEFLKEYSSNENDCKNQCTPIIENEIVNVPGFSYFNEQEIDKIRKISADKIKKRIQEVELEVIREDKIIEDKKIDNIANVIEYLESVSHKFVTLQNLEEYISHILDNPVCHCYAIDTNGKKYYGYTQIPGQKMKSLWDGNPHPSSYETYIDTRKINE